MGARLYLPVAVLVATWLAFGPMAPAWAEDDREAAKSHFSRGTRLYEVGEYRQAIEEFKAAHLAKPDPAFLYNIGQCHRQLGENEQAVTLYKRFLAGSPNATNRAEVEARVAEMEAQLAAGKRKAMADAPASASPPSAASAPAVERAPATPLQVAPEPAPAPAAPAGVVDGMATATAVPAPAPDTGSSLRYWRWVGVGVTAALVGGAIAAGVYANSRYDDLKGGCAKSSAGCSESEIDGLKSRALLANILWGAAGVAAAGTTLIFLLTPQGSTVQVAWRF